MKKNSLILVALSLILCMALPGLALAETTFDGTVVASESVGITAPFGGTINSFKLRQGDQINEGDVIATVETTKVYAPADGVITGVFGQPGDAAEDVVSRVGAVLYIEPTEKYSISADIQYAYNSSDNKYVNIGETVYIHSTSSSYDHEAVGTITAVSGTGYTVETSQGELLMGETVSIYRSSSYDSDTRVGKGTVSRTAEVAVSGSGSILYMHVADGDTVERGDLLFETVTGSLDGLYATSNEIISDVSGVIASVNVNAGSTVAKGDTLVTVYPRDQMQVEIEIDEYDLADIHEGDTMELYFNYDDNSSNTFTTGTVALISHVGTASGTSDVSYYAYIDFTPDENVRLGMTVVANTADADSEDATDSADAAATDSGDTQAVVEAE